MKSVLAHQTVTKERNEGPGTIIQKYGEIYGHQAHRLIDWDDAEKNKVVNMIEERQRKAQQKADTKESKRVKKEAVKAANQAVNCMN